MRRPERAAKKSDWNLLDMPEKRSSFCMALDLSEEDLDALKLGFVPLGMDDRWFSYWDEDHLYVHRSWSGICIYILDFSHGVDDVEVTVNRDEEQYAVTDDAEDMRYLPEILDILLHGPERY